MKNIPKESFIVGIDIGGTNTDAVIVNNKGAIISSIKVTTTLPVEIGFENALNSVITDPGSIKAIMVGTTHATNALLQGKDLYKVGLIRIAGHKPEGIETCFGIQENLKQIILGDEITINGGYECDGRQITDFCEEEVTEAVKKLISSGAEAIAVVGVLSPLYPDQEQKVGKIIEKLAGKSFPYTLSHKVGGIGIVERENTTIINSALIKSLSTGFHNLQIVLSRLRITAPLYITRNNGTIISLDEALHYPVLTIAAGPTNSFIGASKLAGISNAIIIDIGGTSSDCGIVINGFPRRSLNISKIADIKLNFPMPDVISIALGGGSIIRKIEQGFEIGPKSVAGELMSLAQNFGGDTLTLTDSAIKAEITKDFIVSGKIEITKNEAEEIIKTASTRLNKMANDIGASSNNSLPILLVGGGAALIDQKIFEGKVIIPDNFAVANAYGAALAEISVTYDKIVSLENREEKLLEIQNELFAELEEKGANLATGRVIEQIIIPFHYMAGNLARVAITVAGKMK